MTHSMTAFATQQGESDGVTWAWDLRSVNGRGLDIKLRLPDGFSQIEGMVRKRLSAVLTRGNVTIGLRVHRATSETDNAVELDIAKLDVILEALDQVQERAFEKGVTLAQPTAADVLNQRGVLVPKQNNSHEDLIDPVIADFETALAALIDMRRSEGSNLAALLADQVDQIETLTAQAVTAAQNRSDHVKSQMDVALARVMEHAGSADPDRVAQELALIAVKSDITEEIDRLGVHVSAARDLLNKGGAIGRKFDFLTQEFNREANTLCSKAQASALTQIGLALKAVIDQMREQVQNVE